MTEKELPERTKQAAREVHGLLQDFPFAPYFQDIDDAMPKSYARDEILEAVEALIFIGVIIDREGELSLSPCGEKWDGNFLVFAPGIPAEAVEETERFKKSVDPIWFAD